MPRLSNTPQEAAHISRIARGMPFGGVVWVNLKTGLRIDGVLTAERAGNNGGAGNWQFYGELELSRWWSRSRRTSNRANSLSLMMRTAILSTSS